MDETGSPQPGSDERLVHLAPGAGVPRRVLRYQYSRSSGPGGQNVNKVNTRAELRLAVTEIVGLTEQAADRLRRLAGSRLTNDDELLISCDTSRSQRMNRRHCLERLRELVCEAATEPRIRKRTRPSRSKIEKRLQQKREQAEKKSRRRWNPE